MTMLINRRDYDPSNKITFIKTDTIDIRQKKEFNKKTNFYDDIRQDFEQEAPQPRGYIDIPFTTPKKSLFETKLQKTRERARLMGIALKKELVLPVLDSLGNLQFFGASVMKKPYKFEEVLYDKSLSMKQYALQYLNSLQDLEYSQSPEYQLMLELLGQGKAQVDPDLSLLKPLPTT